MLGPSAAHNSYVPRRETPSAANEQEEDEMKKMLILAATIAAALSVGVATSARDTDDAGRLLRSPEHGPRLARRGRERPRWRRYAKRDDRQQRQRQRRNDHCRRQLRVRMNIVDDSPNAVVAVESNLQT